MNVLSNQYQYYLTQCVLLMGRIEDKRKDGKCFHDVYPELFERYVLLSEDRTKHYPIRFLYNELCEILDTLP